MARISGEVTPESMATAIASEQASPTGAMVMHQDMPTDNPDAMAAMCQAMVQAHPGE